MARHLYCGLAFEALVRSGGFIDKRPLDFRALRIVLPPFLTMSGARSLLIRNPRMISTVEFKRREVGASIPGVIVSELSHW